jgi:glutathione S-transferase
MSELILHHYQGSPFSEKVRLVLGMKNLAWRSVIVPMMNPKPDVVALTGGYRRTPFLQIGADVYCDSALMCRVIDRLEPEPPLYPTATAGLDDIVAQWADTSLFWTAVPFTMQPDGIAHIFAGAPAEFLKAFAADRTAMNPAMRRAPVADGGAMLDIYVTRLEASLADGRPFLLGHQPCIADFAAAQSIWFVRRAPVIAARLDGHARTAAWYDRIAAFGHGTPTPLSSAEAITISAGAGTHAPVAVAPGQGHSKGDVVTVTAADYAHDEIAGSLVGLDAAEVVVARGDPRAGSVHVHFPRVGFHVKPVRKEHP